MKTGALIKSLRLKKGLTQEELAERTNLSVRTVQRIENGEVKPRIYTLRAMASALEVAYEEFLNCEDAVFNDASENGWVWLPLLHISGLFLLLFPPVIIWILKKDHVNELKEHGIDVINFQLSMYIFLVPSGLMAGSIITIPVIVFLGLFSTAVILLNTFRVINHQSYRYPIIVRILKS